jgi:hypothetical protein
VKRTAIQRKTPLTRDKPMRRDSPRRISKETPEEKTYKAWLHTRPCVVTGYMGELVQASHVGSGGMGQKKGTWFEAVPMHAEVHQEWGEYTGRFDGWGHAYRKYMAGLWIAETQAAWATVKAGCPF